VIVCDAATAWHLLTLPDHRVARHDDQGFFLTILLLEIFYNVSLNKEAIGTRGKIDKEGQEL